MITKLNRYMFILVVWPFYVISGISQSFDGLVNFLSQKPRPLGIKFHVFHPIHRTSPVKFYEVHLQSNGFVIKRANIVQENKINRNLAKDYECLVKFENMYYVSREGSVFFCDETAASEVPRRIYNSYFVAIYLIHGVLNLGVKYAPLWNIEFSGSDFTVNNNYPSVDNPFSGDISSSLSGTVLVDSTETVLGLDIPAIYVWTAGETHAEKYSWSFNYSYDIRFHDEPNMPSVIDQRIHDDTNGTIRHLRTVIEYFEYREAKDRDFFMPSNVIFDPITFYYEYGDGKWRYTNQFGKIEYTDFSFNEVDINRQHWATIFFPVLMLVLLLWSVYVFLRFGKRNNRL